VRELGCRSVQLRCLDEGRKPLKHASASGFIRIEDGIAFLYTCWHVVTGYDPNDLRVTNALPKRALLEVFIQDQSYIVPLYEGAARPKKPLWYQDRAHRPHPDLNAIGLYVPSWHDAVKIPLPADVSVSESQLVSDPVLSDNTMLTRGDKIYVVGFPYGVSTPVVLTRSVASTAIRGRPVEFLLDSGGAPGMSGGPVFVERDDDIALLGVYTGVIYPASGSCANLSSFWRGSLPLPAPSASRWHSAETGWSGRTCS
jgi:hypothetical protein